MYRGCTQSLAVEKCQGSKRRSTQRVRFIQDRVEHRGNVTGPGVDDLQYLGGRRLAGKRLVALGHRLIQVALRFG